MLKDPSNDIAWNPSLFYALEAAEEEENSRGKKKATKRKRSSNRPRAIRKYALEEVDNLSDSAFQTMFSLSRKEFYALFNKVEPFLNDTHEAMAIRSSQSPISKRTQLHVTLRWLAPACRETSPLSSAQR
jgi:hypothetical protein